MGGVTVQGRVNKYVKREDKNTVYVDMDVFGTGISAHVTVQLYLYKQNHKEVHTAAGQSLQQLSNTSAGRLCLDYSLQGRASMKQGNNMTRTYK